MSYIFTSFYFFWVDVSCQGLLHSLNGILFKCIFCDNVFSGQFFGATIFLLSLSSAMTVLIMKLHFSGEHGSKVPRWLRKIVLVCLARVVRMNKTASQACKVTIYFDLLIIS